jgi:hypothetical protein
MGGRRFIKLNKGFLSYILSSLNISSKISTMSKNYFIVFFIGGVKILRYTLRLLFE